MAVSLDIDNTLIATDSAALAIAAEEAGIPISEVVLTGEYYNCFTHHDPKVASKLALPHSFWEREDLFARALPCEGAVAAAHALKDAGLLRSYVTRRGPTLQAVTRRNLEEHGFPSAPVRFVGHADPVRHHERCKSDACRLDGAETLIDDNPDEIEAVVLKGMRAIMVDASAGKAGRVQLVLRRPNLVFVPTIIEAVGVLLSSASPNA